MGVPPFVLWPAAGFTSITMPELSIETEEIPEGTSNFVHKVLKKASVNNIVLTKGVSMFNSDFWRWTVGCLKGTPLDPNANLQSFLSDLAKAVTFTGFPPVPGKRRNMLLMHCSGISPAGLVEAMNVGGLDAVKGAALLPAAGVTEVAAQVESLTQGLVDIGISSIPGKVYMLFDCLPVRYKPGSDFDAATTAVSIEELELSFNRFEEFSIMG